MSDADTPRRYRLRVPVWARRQIDKEAERLEDLTGEATAHAWIEALHDAMATLVIMPDRCQLAPESKRFTGPWRSARQLLFRRTSSGPSWRILFVIEEPAEEAPTVKILMVRHGARGPMTRKEARQALEE